MKGTHSPRIRRPGFTLIELLVVIAIIAVLAAMGFGAGAMAINNAKKLTTRAAATSLVGAVEGYFDEYNRLPEVSGSGGGGANDADIKSDSKLMNILLALGDDGRTQNPKEIRFYQGKQATAKSTARAFGGVYYRGRENADLFDAWRKIQGGQIRRYQLIMDTNYDEEMDDPFDRSNRLYGVRVIAWSTGRDGLETRGRANADNNQDNVYTWR